MENKIALGLYLQIVQPFWRSAGFWIILFLILIIIAGLIYFYLEIKKREQENFLRINRERKNFILQEYLKIGHKLDQLDIEIEFPEARDLFSDINRRVRRLIAPYKNESEYQEVITSIAQTLDMIKSSLAEVRPIESGRLSDTAVYFAIESHFNELGGQLAELAGLFEKTTFDPH
jgi:hypothetical protein